MEGAVTDPGPPPPHPHIQEIPVLMEYMSAIRDWSLITGNGGGGGLLQNGKIAGSKVFAPLSPV